MDGGHNPGCKDGICFLRLDSAKLLMGTWPLIYESRGMVGGTARVPGRRPKLIHAWECVIGAGRYNSMQEPVIESRSGRRKGMSYASFSSLWRGEMAVDRWNDVTSDLTCDASQV
jgi:hypothetical protein